MIKIHGSGYIPFWKKVTFGLDIWILLLQSTCFAFCYWSSKELSGFCQPLAAECTPITQVMGPIRHACYRTWIWCNKWQQHLVSQVKCQEWPPESKLAMSHGHTWGINILAQSILWARQFHSCLFSLPGSPVSHMIVYVPPNGFFNILFSFSPEMARVRFCYLQLWTLNTSYILASYLPMSPHEQMLSNTYWMHDLTWFLTSRGSQIKEGEETHKHEEVSWFCYQSLGWTNYKWLYEVLFGLCSVCVQLEKYHYVGLALRALRAFRDT